ncbi:hypothetical protein COLSTE_00345 [Collinsella stercoris DSM 13279]|uniref:Uncharacterized protein n=1 Tax=Collinsella stercoris DSM 13279 TaxID=445975 RepID=B6G8G7_9ACTN|nr:hypothetical protein COLSTE_00345 [Collinsella stercoris DSM 13279]
MCPAAALGAWSRGDVRGVKQTLKGMRCAPAYPLVVTKERRGRMAAHERSRKERTAWV